MSGVMEGTEYNFPRFEAISRVPGSVGILGTGVQPVEKGRKYDQGKVRLELIPASLLTAVGKILTFGAQKYSARNWEKGFEWSRAFGALQRHLWAWQNGEDLDAETGHSHLWHAACELAFLIEFEETHPELDDRPRRVGKLLARKEVEAS